MLINQINHNRNFPKENFYKPSRPRDQIIQYELKGMYHRLYLENRNYENARAL